MPIVGILIGGLFNVAACIFAMLKFLAHFKKTTNDQLDQEEPKKDDTVVLLEEIRDLLKKIDKVN